MLDGNAIVADDSSRFASFLESAGQTASRLHLLAAGLSAKRFYRLEDANLVLLDARAAPGLTRRYQSLSEVIAERGCTVPAVRHANHREGLALVDYLGDQPLSQAIDGTADPRHWFMAATRTLAKVHGLKPALTPALPAMDPGRITAEVHPFGRIAASSLTTDSKASSFLADYRAVWSQLARSFPQDRHLVLSDFEPENLMRIDADEGANIGVLDFDEAFFGDQAYDLASLVESARRTTRREIAMECVFLYAELTGQDPAELSRRVALWSLQRHIRILGIFLDRDRPSYPRFKGYVANLLICVGRNLQITELAPLRQLFEQYNLIERLLAQEGI